MNVDNKLANKGWIMLLLKKITLSSLVMLFLGTCTAWADDPITKLARGFENIITSPAEFPIQYIEQDHQGRSVAVTAIAGTFNGVFYTLGRILGGSIEALTFFLSAPPDYKPLMNPATPLESAKEQAERIAAEKKAA